MDFAHCGNFPGCYQKRRRAYMRRDAKYIGLYLFAPSAAVAALSLANIVWNDGASWSWTFLIAAVLSMVLYVALFISVQGDNRVARVVPCFEKRVGEVDTAWSGKQLAAHCRQVDALAQRHGVAPISHFGFADDFEGEEPQWHPAEDGLATLRAVLDAAKQDPELAAVDGLKQDLQAIEKALLRAQAKETRFCLIVLLGVDRSLQNRKGSLW